MIFHFLSMCKIKIKKKIRVKQKGDTNERKRYEI